MRNVANTLKLCMRVIKCAAWNGGNGGGVLYRSISQRAYIDVRANISRRHISGVARTIVRVTRRCAYAAASGVA